MKIPSGPTEFRGGRGRAIFCGGYTPSIVNTIDTVEIATTGDAADFGDLPSIVSEAGGFASATRGFTAGGYTPTYLNNIDFVIFSSGGGGNEFGDMPERTWGTNCCANSTRGIIMGGRANTSDNAYNGGYMDRILFVEMASGGIASFFGDLLRPQEIGLTAGQTGTLTGATYASTTRGIVAGGGTPRTKVIQFITIATKGNALNFGELSQEASRVTGFSSPTRGLSAGGFNNTPSATKSNVIEFVTIATLGNATDFGDLLTQRYTPGSGSSKTRGVVAGGNTQPGFTNAIEFVTIASTGNASDFGDLTQARMTVGSSDTHGGLGE
tara:strand:- start:25 stop:999 length:975 start_codon:yes stop_codon:yes gene_type:complete